MVLGLQEELLKKQNAEKTAQEILRQPKVWKEVYKVILEMEDEIEEIFKNIGYDDRIIFTGAGSSGFIGDYLVPILRKLDYKNVMSFHTTDIVGCPKEYILDTKTILVSFGRSGNSPESVACINIANELIKDITHVIITCNSKGALAQLKGENILSIKLDMLDDLAFAMTSSQSGMTLAGYVLFVNDKTMGKEIDDVCEYVQSFIENSSEDLRKISELDYTRFVVLGSGSLEGLAKEAALKNTELTAGKVASFYNSPLGFRHGPKCQADESTIILYFLSNDEYTKKYDYDMLNELSQSTRKRLVVISDKYDEKVETLADIYYYASKEKNINFGLLNCFYLPICQIIALQHSVFMGITSDNPFPNGSLNRVVAGVTIHSLD